MIFITKIMTKFYFWYYSIDWQLKFSNTTCKAAEVNFLTNCMYVSKRFIRNSPMIILRWNRFPQFPILDLRNIILHEIAHILVGYDAAHGIVWKNKCIEIGGNGEIYSRDFMTQQDYLWKQRCTNKNCKTQRYLYVMRRYRIHCSTCGSYLHSSVNAC